MRAVVFGEGADLYEGFVDGKLRRYAAARLELEAEAQALPPGSVLQQGTLIRLRASHERS